jgi:uncharacterized protein (DUF427 family)
MKAVYKGIVLAESDETVVVEGNHYFPPESVNMEYLQPSDHSTTCPWKGKAAYYTISSGGEVAKNAAWYYPQPKDAAAEIKDHVAFYKTKVDIG